MKVRTHSCLTEFWPVISHRTSKTGFATVSFLPTFRVGDKLRFLGHPGVLFGRFPVKSKPEAQFFVN